MKHVNPQGIYEYKVLIVPNIMYSRPKDIIHADQVEINILDRFKMTLPRGKGTDEYIVFSLVRNPREVHIQRTKDSWLVEEKLSNTDLKIAAARQDADLLAELKGQDMSLLVEIFESDLAPIIFKLQKKGYL